MYTRHIKQITNIRSLKIHSNIRLTFEYTKYSDIRPSPSKDVEGEVQGRTAKEDAYWTVVLVHMVIPYAAVNHKCCPDLAAIVKNNISIQKRIISKHKARN